MAVKALIVVSYYLPGFKSGGPQQTVINICEAFKDKADIQIITKNYDFGEKIPYKVETNRWLNLYGIKVMYLDDKDFNSKILKKIVPSFDVVYACGLFFDSTIKLMLINWKHRDMNLYVAPMGVFSENALASKHLKKKVFLDVFSHLGVFKKFTWSFTSEMEYQETIKSIGSNNVRRYVIAEDLPRKAAFDHYRNIRKASGQHKLSIIFLSRITRKKNLSFIADILNTQFSGKIKLDIYGVIEDEDYWNECKIKLDRFPENIEYEYCGSIDPAQSIDVFSRHDVFLFPTLGENFGHVIYEALAGGCIPIISNTTPWSDLTERKIGAVVELEDIEGFRKSIRTFLNADAEELNMYKLNCVNYAEEKYNDSTNNTGYADIFVRPEEKSGSV